MTYVPDQTSINNFTEYVKNVLKYDQLPDDTTLMTMTLYCKFTSVKFNLVNINNYIKYNSDRIGVVTPKDKKISKKKTYVEIENNGVLNDINKCLTKQKRRDPDKEGSKRNTGLSNNFTDPNKIIRTRGSNDKSLAFFNQLTLNVKVDSKNKPVSAKLFPNGTVHLTGCIKIDDIVNTVIQLCIELSQVYCKFKKGKMVEMPFCQNVDKFRLEFIEQFNFAMVNVYFHVPFNIDKSALFIQMLEDKFFHEPLSESKVIIKYKIPTDIVDNEGEEVYVSIVINDNKKINIMGSKNCLQIKSAHDFIIIYILKNIKKVIKTDFTFNALDMALHDLPTQ